MMFIGLMSTSLMPTRGITTFQPGPPSPQRALGAAAQGVGERGCSDLGIRC